MSRISRGDSVIVGRCESLGTLDGRRLKGNPDSLVLLRDGLLDSSDANLKKLFHIVNTIFR
jgi:hypothetical protein